MIEQYIVTVDRPEGVTKTRMKYYIEEAVGTWQGQYDPVEDPMFDLNGDSVKVKSFNPKSKLLGE